MRNGKSEQIIDRLTDMIENGQNVPLSAGKVMINRDEACLLLAELKNIVLGELKVYREVTDKRGKILNDAKKEAEDIIVEAEQSASRIRVTKGMSKVGMAYREKALNIEEKEALRTAGDIYAASLIYTDEMLTEVNDVVMEASKIINDQYGRLVAELNDKAQKIADNKAELMASLKEMSQDDRYAQILDLGQLLSLELYNEKNKIKEMEKYGNYQMEMNIGSDNEVNSGNTVYVQPKEKSEAEIKSEPERKQKKKPKEKNTEKQPEKEPEKEAETKPLAEPEKEPEKENPAMTEKQKKEAEELRLLEEIRAKERERIARKEAEIASGTYVEEEVYFEDSAFTEEQIAASEVIETADIPQDDVMPESPAFPVDESLETDKDAIDEDNSVDADFEKLSRQADQINPDSPDTDSEHDKFVKRSTASLLEVEQKIKELRRKTGGVIEPKTTEEIISELDKKEKMDDVVEIVPEKEKAEVTELHPLNEQEAASLATPKKGARRTKKSADTSQSQKAVNNAVNMFKSYVPKE